MDERYAFVAEWFDPYPCIMLRYQLMYYPRDGTVEMFDVRNQRLFLRRTRCENINLSDLYIGNRIFVCSRQLSLVAYGDLYTENILDKKKERTLALIKPDALDKIGHIIEMIYTTDLVVTKAKMTTVTGAQAADFYMEEESKPYSTFLHVAQHISSGPFIVLELMGEQAIRVWRRLLGPTDPPTAKEEAQHSVRALYGTDSIRNAAHGSHSYNAAARELQFFFPPAPGHGPANTAKFVDCTCCIIKPHAMTERSAGKILKSIMEAGFEISALQMFSISRVHAEKFYEVYKGVVTETMHSSMVNELCSGPCMVLEIRGTGSPKTFREFCGPVDPGVARILRPTTLRALYGKDKVQNAVHCTDIPEDGTLEVQYFFKVMDAGDLNLLN